MPRATWAVLFLLVFGVTTAALAQPSVGEQPRDPGHDTVSVDETEGSALPYYAGGNARYSREQRIIFWMLVGLISVTLFFGGATIAHVVQQHRRGVP